MELCFRCRVHLGLTQRAKVLTHPDSLTRTAVCVSDNQAVFLSLFLLSNQSLSATVIVCFCNSNPSPGPFSLPYLLSFLLSIISALFFFCSLVASSVALKNTLPLSALAP